MPGSLAGHKSFLECEAKGMYIASCVQGRSATLLRFQLGFLFLLLKVR